MENVRNRVKIEITKNEDNEKNIEHQSKLTFIGTHKCYTIYDSYSYNKNEVFMDKPIYLGFAVLKLSKFLMYETFYDKLQPIFGRKIKSTVTLYGY